MGEKKWWWRLQRAQVAATRNYIQIPRGAGTDAGMLKSGRKNPHSCSPALVLRSGYQRVYVQKIVEVNKHLQSQRVNTSPQLTAKHRQQRFSCQVSRADGFAKTSPLSKERALLAPLRRKIMRKSRLQVFFAECDCFIFT